MPLGSSGGTHRKAFYRQVHPPFDWPLSHEEKKRAALRLYDRDVRAADCIIRSGEERCRELQLQLQAARAAQHDEEVAERLRLAIESATLALNVLLRSAGNGAKASTDGCPTLQMVDPHRKSLPAPTARARSEGAEPADCMAPRGVLRQPGSSHSRPRRRVSFSDDPRDNIEEGSVPSPWGQLADCEEHAPGPGMVGASSSADCGPVGGQEPEPPDPLTPERAAASSPSSSGDAALVLQNLSPQRLFMEDGAFPPGSPRICWSPCSSGLAATPSGVPQAFDFRCVAGTDSSHDDAFDLHAAPLLAAPLDPWGQLPAAACMPTPWAGSSPCERPLPGMSAAEDLPEGSVQPRALEASAGPVCFSISTPRSPSQSPPPSPKLTARRSRGSQGNSLEDGVAADRGSHENAADSGARATKPDRSERRRSTSERFPGCARPDVPAAGQSWRFQPLRPLATAAHGAGVSSSRRRGHTPPHRMELEQQRQAQPQQQLPPRRGVGITVGHRSSTGSSRRASDASAGSVVAAGSRNGRAASKQSAGRVSLHDPCATFSSAASATAGAGSPALALCDEEAAPAAAAISDIVMPTSCADFI